MSEHNCPNCGDRLDVTFAKAKMTTCQSCDTALFLNGRHIENAGFKGDWHAAPALFQLTDHVQLEGVPFHIVGHARFDYGPGWWDEYWAQDDQGGGAWISVDEGDIILQRALPFDKAPTITRPPTLGRAIEHGNQQFVVSEADKATCLAVRGDFPEVLRVGEKYSFVNCQGPDAQLLSGEFGPDWSSWFLGVWIDPFDAMPGAGT